MYLKFTKPWLIFDILKQEWKYTVIFEDWTTKPIDTTDENLIELWYIMTEELEIQDLNF